MKTTFTLLLLSALGLATLHHAPDLAPRRLQLGPITVQLAAECKPVEAPTLPSVAPEEDVESLEQDGGTVHPRHFLLPARPQQGFVVPNRFEIETPEGTVRRMRVTAPPRSIRTSLFTNAV